jgi:hypothetical protein
LRRHRAPERADTRLPAGRGGRAPAGDPAVRLGARHDGRGGTHGRGGGRRPRRPELRLPRSEGDEDRRRRDAPRPPRPRRPDRRGDRGSRERPGDRQAASRPPRRVARLPRGRAAARRGGRRLADAPSPLCAADVHGQRRPRAHRRARVARGRSRDRVRRHRLASEGPDSARDDRRPGGHGRPRRPGQPLGARGDRGRLWPEADARGGRRRARAVRPRSRPRARRAPCERVPEEVLRLVPRVRTLPEAVQAGARRARLDRGGRAAPVRRRPGCDRARRAPRGRDPERRRGHARAPDLDLRRRPSSVGEPMFPPRTHSFSVATRPRAGGLPAGKAGLRPRRWASRPTGLGASVPGGRVVSGPARRPLSFASCATAAEPRARSTAEAETPARAVRPWNHDGVRPRQRAPSGVYPAERRGSERRDPAPAGSRSRTRTSASGSSSLRARRGRRRSFRRRIAGPAGTCGSGGGQCLPSPRRAPRRGPSSARSART